MHELSVAQALLDQVESHASQHGAQSVGRIVVRIGPLSGIVPELLETAWTLAAAGSVAEQADLQLEAQPVRVRCRSCGAESDAAPNRLLCAACGDWQTDLVSGDELLLASLELIGTADA